MLPTAVPHAAAPVVGRLVTPRATNNQACSLASTLAASGLRRRTLALPVRYSTAGNWGLQPERRPAARAQSACVASPLAHSRTTAHIPLAETRPTSLRAVLLTAIAALALTTLALALPQSATAAARSATATAASEPSMWAQLASFVIHLDKHLSALVAASKVKTYAVLFAIVFAETGLVVTPFLPGDSLLFAAGTLAALGSLSLPLLMGLLFVAAVAGDTVNYAAGKSLGAAAFSSYPSVFRPEYLDKTRAFFAAHGPKTIVLARFVPIVRTFAPFIAGVGSMSYPTFVLYNIAGAAIWVFTFCVAGFALGNVPAVRHNFALVTVAIVLVSLLPVAHELLEARRQHK